MPMICGFAQNRLDSLGYRRVGLFSMGQIGLSESNVDIRVVD